MAVFDNEPVFDGGNPLSDYSSTTLGYQPSTRTAADVIRQVQRLFGDEAGAQILASDIISWINDAQDMIVNKNRSLKARAFTDSIKGVSGYKFPNENIIQIESLHYNGDLLDNLAFAEAEQRGYMGDGKTGTPRFWWEWSGTFTLWPTPDSPAQIIIYYTTGATRVVTATDTLGVPDKYYQTVLTYVLKQSYILDENFQAAQQMQVELKDALDTFGEEERSAQNMTYDSVTVIDEFGDYYVAGFIY